MLIQIPQTGVIKKQKFDIGEDVSIIYGYNNSGKTTILKVLDDAFRNRLMENSMEQFVMCMWHLQYKERHSSAFA